ncbi:MAG: protein kinase [Polyangiaceae bacterium]|nr:protein kinase [Polyangiaceae bacterium]
MSEADALIGTLIADRYRVVRKLGEGGMGVVYEALHEALRKPVALKLLTSSGRIDREAVARFEREAIAAANLRHPNIAEATDFGRLPDGALYLVMEYVEGTTLRRVLRNDGRLAPDRAFAILEQVGAALSTAHARDVVHRDLKPENIIITQAQGRSDYVKVIDFGIARIRNATFGGGATGLTKAGTVFGTPEYMAPEQVMGQAVDARCDQYALGVLAFELLTGKPPFSADDIGQLMMKHVGAPVPSARTSTPALLPATDAVVMRMLSKLPDERFATVDEAILALKNSLSPAPNSVASPPQSKPTSQLSPIGNPTVRLGPSSANEADATAKTLQSFAFDAAYTTGPASGTARMPVPSMNSVHASASPIGAVHASPAPPTAAHNAPSLARTAHPPAPNPVEKLFIAAQKAGPKVLALIAGGVLISFVVLALIVRALTSGGGLSSEVVTALGDWKNGNTAAAAPVIRSAVAADSALANDVVIARTLAESIGEEGARAALDDLLQTTALGRSTVMAAALADVAVRDESKPRDNALELLRDRQDLLTQENASRVRLRDAEDCEELSDAKKEEADVNTPGTQRDLERLERDDCKRLLRKKELCEQCRGGGKGPGIGIGGGKGKKGKDKKK